MRRQQAFCGILGGRFHPRPMSDLSALRPRLDAGLHALQLPVEPLATRLLAYLELLARWNATYNLTAIRDPQQMLTLHLLDSLAIAPFVHGRVADIGSGAGLPGLVLALARPDIQVTSIESAGKKARFQREAVRVLGLANVSVLAERAEQAPRGEGFDCVLSRAFGSLAQFVRVGGHLLRDNGRLLAMKGVIPADEIAALPAGWTLVATRALAVPGLDAQRHLLEIERVSTDEGSRT